MIVTSTELQNNFGAYLDLCKREQVIITRNGKRRALLLPLDPDSHGYEVLEPESAYGASNPNRVSYQEFIELTEQDDQRYELIDGVVYLLAAPSFSHQRALGLLHLLLVDYLGSRENCTPVLAPFDIRLTRHSVSKRREPTKDDLNVVQPDLVVICDYKKDINEQDQFWGIPQLAIEILSPSTRSNDCIKKLDLYMDSGIKECWLVDPLNSIITIYYFDNYEMVETRVAVSGRAAESVLFPGLQVSVEGVLGTGE
jgi:prevent-host-death family protein